MSNLVTQRSEDPARNLRGVWLGPTGAWRWPFDATYTEWAIGVLVYVATLIALWFALPSGVLMVAFCVFSARWMSDRMDRHMLARWTWTTPDASRRRARRILTTVNLLFAVLLFPYPAAWLLPFSVWAAAPLALVSAVLFVRAARPWIDGNRPVGYWLAALWGIARGPRARRQPMVLAFEGAPQVPDQPLDDALAEFMAAVAALKEEEIDVMFARRRTPVVEAMVFDAGNHEKVVQWLQRKGFQVRVLDVRRRVIRGTEGGEYTTPVSARIQVGPLPVENGQVVVVIDNADLSGRGPVVEAWDYEQFRVHFEEVAL